MLSEQIRAAVIGSTGYGGVELIRLLLSHPHVTITSVISSSSAGERIAEGFPHLTEILTDRLDEVDPQAIRMSADVVFAATPSGVSSALVPKLLAAGLKVIDLSGDFRIKDRAVYETWYKHPAAEQVYLDQAVYGLAEVRAQEVREAGFISNPGCYATAALLGLIPALHQGLIAVSPIIIDGKSGTSGAGRKTTQAMHFSEMNENLWAYKINHHQHTPEIEQELSRISGRPVTVTFTPHVVPMTRGIMCTIYTQLKEKLSEDEIIAAYREYYSGRKFVRIRERGKWPATKEVWGSNYCDIGFSIDERPMGLTIVSVIDNLVKGAAGQAVQNLNLMMGWDEDTGLHFTPVYP